MNEPDKVVFLVNDKRSTSTYEEYDKVKALTLEELQTFINSDISPTTGPAGPQGSSGVIGPPGPAGLNGATGPGPVFETQYVETLMRTPLSIVLGPTGVSDVTIAEGTTTRYGTLSSIVSNTVTFTPKPRVPRYPEKNASDMFTYTGIYNGFTVLGIIHINIKIATPTNKYLATTASGDLYGSKYVGSTVTNEQITGLPAWQNMIATNNIDGIVLHADSSNVIRFWDPVDGATGSVSIGSYYNYVASYDSDDGATFDNDNGFLYIYSQPTTGSPSTVWFYRIAFKTFETGGSLVVSSIEVGCLYDDTGYSSAVEQDDFGDVAWDPISKRIWGSSEGFGTGGSDRVLWYTNTLSSGFSGSLGNDPPYIANYQHIVDSSFLLSQLTFNYDGTILIRSYSSTLYTIDVRTINVTTIGSTSVTYTDLAPWPVTLDENFV